ncbi:zf-HC2 domain-containing protein [Sphingomonas sp. KC8]|uniref:zf-HC2 domain-containing protein n=1 Tax=Sphingomonas sp. KC8 TaxID=1030157 RepID=UPI000248B1E8|nr:zf-HC2 domain-containing protein [Sphingomonas sp. KC8]ARS26806.1 hypothetical protein KC8_05835 [Sphingomonas sp. KC8]
MINDETLFAYLDGELPAAEAARVEEALAIDPALREKLSAQRALRERLQRAFDPITSEELPAALAHATAPRGATVIDMAAARTAKAQRVPKELGGWAAIAAALVAGLVGGYLMNAQPNGPAIERDGRMIAAAPIASALDRQLASAGKPQGPVQVHLTFRDASGAICRSFAAPAASGVACHEQDRWIVRALFAPDKQQDGPYRTAASGSAALLAYIDGVIAGEPFDAAAEDAARATGWRLPVRMLAPVP